MYHRDDGLPHQVVNNSQESKLQKLRASSRTARPASRHISCALLLARPRYEPERFL